MAKKTEDKKSILSFVIPNKLHKELLQKIGKGKIGDFLRQAAEKKLKEQEIFLVKAYQSLEESSEYKSYDKKIMQSATILTKSWGGVDHDKIDDDSIKKEIVRGGIYPVNCLTKENKKKEIYKCMVISNNIQNEISQYLVVMPITSLVFPSVPFHTQILLKDNETATIIAERIHIVNKLWLGSKIDEIEIEKIVEIRKSLLLTLESHSS